MKFIKRSSLSEINILRCDWGCLYVALYSVSIVGVSMSEYLENKFESESPIKRQTTRRWGTEIAAPLQRAIHL